VANQGRDIAKKLDIILGETNLGPGFVPSCLLGGATRIDSYGSSAKAFKDVRDSPREAVAVGEQEDYRRNAPGHTEGSKDRAPQVETHCAERLVEDVALHRYSFRSASTGSSDAALRAG
jgi:hypothetical protein